MLPTTFHLIAPFYNQAVLIPLKLYCTEFCIALLPKTFHPIAVEKGCLPKNRSKHQNRAAGPIPVAGPTTVLVSEEASTTYAASHQTKTEIKTELKASSSEIHSSLTNLGCKAVLEIKLH